jgi:WD40 repeat protein
MMIYWRPVPMIACLLSMACQQKTAGESSVCDDSTKQTIIAEFRAKGIRIAILQGNAIHAVNYADKRALESVAPVSANGASISAISTTGFPVIALGLFSGFVIVDAGGGELWRSSQNLHLGDLQALALSNDGHRFACQNRRGVCYVDIAVESPVWVWERGKNDTLRDTKISGSLAWSENGDQLLFSYDNAIWRYDLTTETSRKIADGIDPTWSADGRWITFRGPDGSAMVLDAQGNEPIKRLEGIKPLGPLKWAPVPGYLLYEKKDENWSAHKYIPSDGLGSQLAVYRVRDGKECVVLDPMYKGMGRDFGWLVVSR